MAGEAGRRQSQEMSLADLFLEWAAKDRRRQKMIRAKRERRKLSKTEPEVSGKMLRDVTAAETFVLDT